MTARNSHSVTTGILMIMITVLLFGILSPCESNETEVTGPTPMEGSFEEEGTDGTGPGAGSGNGEFHGTVSVPLSRAVNENIGMDYTPGNGKAGGLFEDGNNNNPNDWSLTHKNGWITQKAITNDDFDDTEDVTNSWTRNEGIYSFVRNDEDLNDGTGQDGAWCVQAGENGGAAISEDSRGLARCYRWFDLDDYIFWDDYTITRASVWLDYKIYSTDFDNSNNFVMLTSYIGDGTNNLMLEHFKVSSDGLAADNGKCIDFWDVDDPASGVSNPQVSVDNKLLDTLSGGGNLPNFFNTHAVNTREFLLIFGLQIRLYGTPWYDFEWFKFWLDDVWISFDYSATALSTRASANTVEGYAPFDVGFSSATTGGLAPFSHSWNFGDGGSSQSANPNYRFNNPGTYNVRLTVTDDHARTDSDTVTVIVHAVPTATIVTSSPNPATATERISFRGSMSGGWGPMSMADWDFGDGNFATGEAPNHAYASDGTYTVRFRAKDSHDTYTQWVTRQITVNRRPTATISSILPNPATEGVDIRFTGSGSHGTGSLSYEWDFGDSHKTTTRNPTHSYSSAGTYTVAFKVKDSHNIWSQTVTSTVVINRVPVAAINSVAPDPATATESITFSSSGSHGTGAHTFSWDFDDGDTSASQNPTHAYQDAGVYSVKLKVRDSQNVWSPVVTSTITVNPRPLAQIDNIGPNPATHTEALSFTSSGTGGTGGIVEYQWNMGGETRMDARNPTYTFSGPGSYTVELKVRDSHGIWSEFVTKDVMINPLPVAETTSIRPSPATVTGPVSFMGAGTGGTGGIVGFSWDFGDGNSDDVAGSTHVYTKDRTYEVSLKVRDSHGVWSEPAITELVVNPLPLAIIESVSIDPATVSESILFCGSGSRGTGGIVEYSWDFGDGGSDTSSSPTHVYGESGEHVVTFKVRDSLDVWSEPAEIDVTLNPLPLAAIDEISPSTGSQGGSVHFTGSGSGGTGEILGFQWQSSIDGVLSDKDEFSTASLSVGIHTIHLKVQDSHGIWGEAVMQKYTIKADPGAPVASIISVTPSKCGYGETVQFSGSASGGSGTYTKYMWRSDIDGVLSNERSFKANNLSVGDHILYFKALDNKDRWSSEVTGSVTIQVAEDAPVANIISIVPSPAYSGETVTFTGIGDKGTGVYIEFRWRSDMDGTLSISDSFSTSSLTPGIHKIYFSVRDSDSLWSEEAAEELSVIDTVLAPGAVIESVAPNPSVQDDEVAFIGRGEPISGDIVLYQWYSDIDGELSSRTSFKIDSLSVGYHIISFRVKDSNSRWSPPTEMPLLVKGKEGAPVSSVDSIIPNPAKEGDLIAFKGNVRDGSGTYVEFKWRSDIEGVISTQREFEVKLGAGDHIIYFKVKDSTGLWSSENRTELTVNSVRNRLRSNLVITTATPCVDEIVTFRSVNHSSQADRFLFAFGDGQSTEWISEDEAVYKYSQPGIYIARLRLKDADGNLGDFSWVEVTVREKESRETAPSDNRALGEDYYIPLLVIGGILLLMILFLIVKRRKTKERSIIEDLEPVEVDLGRVQDPIAGEEMKEEVADTLGGTPALVPDAVVDVVRPKFPKEDETDLFSQAIVPKYPKGFGGSDAPYMPEDLFLPEITGLDPGGREDMNSIAFPSTDIPVRSPGEGDSPFAFKFPDEPSVGKGKFPPDYAIEKPALARGKKAPKIVKEIRPEAAASKKIPKIVRELPPAREEALGPDKKGRRRPKIVASSGPVPVPVPASADKKGPIVVKKVQPQPRAMTSIRPGKGRDDMEQMGLNEGTKSKLDSMIKRFKQATGDEDVPRAPMFDKKSKDHKEVRGGDSHDEEKKAVKGQASSEAQEWLKGLMAKHGSEDSDEDADDVLPVLKPE